VELTDNKVETLPEALGILTNLEVIDACRNKIGSVKSLGPLHNLVTLKLDQNEISSLSLMQVIVLELLLLLLQKYFLTGTKVQILTRERMRAVEEADEAQHAQRLVQSDRRGKQFICFTSTKVQMLTGEEQLDEKMGRLPALTSLNLSNNAIKVLSFLALLV
jgi:hypothetical protein